MPTLNRRRLAATVIAAFACTALAPRVHAEDFPSKPIHIIVIVAPGGSADGVARLVGEGLSKRVGQPVIVENRPGAGGNIAAQFVSRSAPDGYTLLLTSNNHTINPSLFANAGYGINDFQPVAELMEGPSVIAVPANSPYRTLADLLGAARAKPDSISYGSAGIGLPSHIAGESLQRAANVRLSHVPYRGSGPSLVDAIGGQLPVVIASLIAAMPHIESGKLRALAVTSIQRWPTAPTIPAASETVPGYSHVTWLGLLAPKNTPASVTDRLNKEIQAVLDNKDMKARIDKLGGAVVLQDPSTFDAFLKKSYTQDSRLVAETGMRAD